MNIINNDLSNNSFSNEAKVATVRPIYKKKSRDKIENYRPTRNFFLRNLNNS